MKKLSTKRKLRLFRSAIFREKERRRKRVMPSRKRLNIKTITPVGSHGVTEGSARRVIQVEIFSKKIERKGYHPKYRWFEFVLDGELDFINNTEHTAEQFSKFSSISVVGSYGVVSICYVDMSGVTRIDPCSLLYLAAQIDRVGDRDYVYVVGCYPDDELAKKTLIEAGFDEFLSLSKNAMRNSTTLKIYIESITELIDPDMWWSSNRGIEKFLSDTDCSDELLEHFYMAFHECIENVKFHAFSASSEGNWFTLALAPSNGEPARAVILDLGIGIPSSIRNAKAIHVLNDVYEKIVSELSHSSKPYTMAPDIAFLDFDDYKRRNLSFDDVMDEAVKDDANCLLLATQGAKTRTREIHRGKGLSHLKKVATSTESASLHVVSGRARVSWSSDSNDPDVVHMSKIKGTVVCLELFPLISEAME